MGPSEGNSKPLAFRKLGFACLISFVLRGLGTEDRASCMLSPASRAELMLQRSQLASEKKPNLNYNTNKETYIKCNQLMCSRKTDVKTPRL